MTDRYNIESCPNKPNNTDETIKTIETILSIDLTSNLNTKSFASNTSVSCANVDVDVGVDTQNNTNTEENVNDWTRIIEEKQKSEIEILTPMHVSIESRYVTKIEGCRGKDNRSKHTEHVSIDDIKLEDIKFNNDLSLLEKSSMIAKNLKFQFNKRFTEDVKSFNIWITTSLQWLRDVMFELANRTSQIINISTINKKASTFGTSPRDGCLRSNISRNSYKFCEFGHACKFNYEKNQVCYAQHYVYDLVYLDILDILWYISDTYAKAHTNTHANTCGTTHTTTHANARNSNPDFLHECVNEIKTSVNTITYVINHMLEELTQLKLSCPDQYREYENRTYKLKVVGYKCRTKNEKKNERNEKNEKKKIEKKIGNKFGKKNINKFLCK
jgi:hypothetical protein